MRSRTGALAAAMLLVALAGGCSSGSPDRADDPVFGESRPTMPAKGELARAKAAAGVEDCPATTAAKVLDNGLPALRLDCLGGGRSVRLAGLRGTPTVINLWASWCAPCRSELPLLARADRAFGARVRILGIDFADDAPDLALDLAQRSGVTYPLVSDPESAVKRDLKVVGLPQTVFVDAQGTIVATERRAYRSYDELTTAISKHLGVTP